MQECRPSGAFLAEYGRIRESVLRDALEWGARESLAVGRGRGRCWYLSSQVGIWGRAEGRVLQPSQVCLESILVEGISFFKRHTFMNRRLVAFHSCLLSLIIIFNNTKRKKTPMVAKIINHKNEGDGIFSIWKHHDKQEKKLWKDLDFCLILIIPHIIEGLYLIKFTIRYTECWVIMVFERKSRTTTTLNQPQYSKYWRYLRTDCYLVISSVNLQIGHFLPVSSCCWLCASTGPHALELIVIFRHCQRWKVWMTFIQLLDIKLVTTSWK